MSNPELNERDLENVSGGATAQEGQVRTKYCMRCDLRHECGPRYQDLTKYVQANGEIGHCTNCPFRKEVIGARHS